jgi:archaellum component FlaC
MNTSDLIPDNAKKTLKSFWEKPEGKIGIGITAIFLFGAFLFGYAAVLPWFIELAHNTLKLIGFLVAIGLIAVPMCMPDIRLKVIIGYKLLLRKMAGFIIKVDPIAILKETIRRGRARLEIFEENIVKLKQVMGTIKNKINSYSSSAQESMLAAQAAQKKNVKSQVFLQTRQAGRLKGAVTELSTVYARLEALYRVLTKMYENAGTILQDTEQEVSLTEDKWKAIRTSYSAMSSAMKALRGDKDERALYEETMEYVNEDLGAKMGEIDYMLDASETIMDSIDVRNGMFEEKGMQMLDDFEKKADTWLLGSEQPTAPALSKLGTNEAGQVISTANPERPNQFSNLFGK